MEEIARQPIDQDVTHVSIYAHESGNVTITAVVGRSWLGALGVGSASSRAGDCYLDVFGKALSGARAARAAKVAAADVAAKVAAADVAAAEFGGLMPAIR
jgi:hypothetical protein